MMSLTPLDWVILEVMKIFENKEEAINSREKYITVSKSDDIYDEYLKHSKKWSFFDTHSKFKHRSFGKFFLYEEQSHKGDNSILYYPKLGLYINELPCDQTMEVEWVEYRPRTWEWNTKYKHTYKDHKKKDKEFTIYLGEVPTEIKRLILWNDDLLVYGAWDSMPNWRELRQSYERTWWFYRTEEERRDIQLSRILK